MSAALLIVLALAGVDPDVSATVYVDAAAPGDVCLLDGDAQCTMDGAIRGDGSDAAAGGGYAFDDDLTTSFTNCASGAACVFANGVESARFLDTGVTVGSLTVNSAGGADAVLSEAGLSRTSGSGVIFDFTNPGAGAMSLEVDGALVHTTANGGAGSLFDSDFIDGLSSSSLALSATTITAGAGLTGGGSLAANRTIDVVANADGSIVANANDIQVGVLATDAQHGNRGGGALHANAVASGAAGFLSGTDKAKLDGLPSNAYATVQEEGSSLTQRTTLNFVDAGITAADVSSKTQVSLNDFTSTTHGAVPLSGGGTTNFLRADGSWAVPPGAGGGGTIGGTIATGQVCYASGTDTCASEAALAYDATINLLTAGQSVLIAAAAGQNALLTLNDADVAHGITGVAATSTYFSIQPWSGAGGGAYVIAAHEDGTAAGDVAFGLQAMFGTTGSLSSTSSAFSFGGAKKSGTAAIALTQGERLFALKNGAVDVGTDVLVVLAGGGTTLASNASNANTLLTLTAGTLASTKRAITATATLSTTSGATQDGYVFNATSAGSASTGSQRGMEINLLPGFTGSAPTLGFFAFNEASGTAKDLNLNNAGSLPVGNIGSHSFAYPDAAVASLEVASSNEAALGDVNVAALNKATTAKNSAINIGTLSIALNTGTSPTQIAGYFGLQATAHASFVAGLATAALIADNGAVSADIFVARDNGTAVFTIGDSGAVVATGSIVAGGSTTTNITARTKLLQDSSSGATAVVGLRQADTDEPFIDFEGSSAADKTTNISTQVDGNTSGVAGSTPVAAPLASAWTLKTMVRVEIGGADYWIPAYQ